jgi:hypothetical protein
MYLSANYRVFKTQLLENITRQEETKGRLNLENAWDHSVQGLFSSRLLFRNVKVKTQKNIILP